MAEKQNIQEIFTKDEVEGLNTLSNMLHKDRIERLDSWAPNMGQAVYDSYSFSKDKNLDVASQRVSEFLGFAIPYYFERCTLLMRKIAGPDSVEYLTYDKNIMDTHLRVVTMEIPDKNEIHYDSTLELKKKNFKVTSRYLEMQSIINSVPFIYDQQLMFGKALVDNRERWKVKNVDNEEILRELGITAMTLEVMDFMMKNMDRPRDSVPDWTYKPKTYVDEELKTYLFSNSSKN